MHEGDAALLEGLFKRYYFESAASIKAPPQIGQREFGYQRFNGSMVRHLALKDENELRLMLVSNAPAGVYCSNAYYSFPDLEMDQKDWKGADLIFDIDAKDLALECRDSHTVRLCRDCQAPCGDASPCGRCSSTRRSQVSVTCGRCIDASKAEVIKLREILTDDFGIDPRDIRTYFSGNEGFHVYAHAPPLEGLSSRERNELVDYIRFSWAVPERFGMTKGQKKNLDLTLPETDEGGWGGRVARHLFRNKTGRRKFIAGLGSGAYGAYQEALREAAGSAGARIDPHVTTDTHRIFRMPGSINGKSGLAKVLCADLDGFDPYDVACVLGGSPLEVIANCPVSFRLKGTDFGPYRGERVSVPGYAAAYMICKGLATAAGRA